MKLIGMLDSPYVRRVAISLDLYEVDFVHEPLSVFRTFNEFAEINPVVKAPTLVLDDGTVLMDSSLILDYLETLAPDHKKLLPQQAAARAQDLHVLGLAWPWRPVRKACRSSMNTTCAPPKNCMRPGSTASAANCWPPIHCWIRN